MARRFSGQQNGCGGGCGVLLLKGMVLPGILALGGALVPSLAQRYLNAALTASTPAQILEIKTIIRNNKNSTYCPTTVRYRYTIDGVPQEDSDCLHHDRLNADWGLGGDPARKFAVGQPAIVCYDPANAHREIVVPGSYSCPPGVTPWRRWWEGAGAGLVK